MKRYSIVYGSNENNTYQTLWNSKHLAAFINSLNADVNITLRKTQGFMTGFTKLQSYDREMVLNAPVSIRYSPLYFSRIEGMNKDMGPFCALSINGNEQIPGRGSQYYHMFLLDYNELIESCDGSTFLDQLFGTRITTWRDIEDLRSGKGEKDFDYAPQKITPAIQNRDKKYIYSTIEGIYDKKKIVIVLEKDAAFNNRSIEILTEIYSMMQPVVAVETGFATYVSVTDIEEISTKTQTRIFVVPSGTDLDKLNKNDFVVLDLNKIGYESKNSEFTASLLNWELLNWNRRNQALAWIFAKDSEYKRLFDKELFVLKTKAFFEDPFFAWVNNKNDSTNFSTLEEIIAKKKLFSICEIPWVEELFIKKAKKMITQNTSFENLVGHSGAELILSIMSINGKKAKKSQINDVQFGLANTSDTATLLSSFSYDLKSELDLAKDREISEIKAEQKREVDRIEDEKRNAIALYEGKADEAKAKMRSIEQELSATKVELEKTSRKLKESEKRADEISAQHKKEIKDKNKQLDQEIAEKKKYYIENKELQKAIELKNSLNNDLEKQIKEKEEEVERTKTEIEKIKAKKEKATTDNNRPWYIFAAAGFLAGALILGIIWCIVALVNQKPEDTTTVGSEPSIIIENSNPSPEPVPSVEDKTDPFEERLNYLGYKKSVDSVPEGMNKENVESVWEETDKAGSIVAVKNADLKELWNIENVRLVMLGDKQVVVIGDDASLGNAYSLTSILSADNGNTIVYYRGNKCWVDVSRVIPDVYNEANMTQWISDEDELEDGIGKLPGEQKPILKISYNMSENIIWIFEPDEADLSEDKYTASESVVVFGDNIPIEKTDFWKTESFNSLIDEMNFKVKSISTEKNNSEETYLVVLESIMQPLSDVEIRIRNYSDSDNLKSGIVISDEIFEIAAEGNETVIKNAFSLYSFLTKREPVKMVLFNDGVAYDIFDSDVLNALKSADSQIEIVNTQDNDGNNDIMIVSSDINNIKVTISYSTQATIINGEERKATITVENNSEMVSEDTAVSSDIDKKTDLGLLNENVKDNEIDEDNIANASNSNETDSNTSFSDTFLSNQREGVDEIQNEIT